MNDAKKPRLILRYTAGQRINHWIIAITFVLLALSGLALFHPAFYWMSNLLGGGVWTRILHPFIGVLMFLCFVVFAARMFRHNLMSRRDWRWLAGFRDVLNKREENVPEAGRYNGGQKLLFFAMILLLLGLLLTGLVMWRSYFAFLFPIWAIRLASLLHALFAFLMICAIIVHIYAGIWVKGSVRAMTRGTVTPGWAWKHHRAWLRQLRGGAGSHK
ncbi:formate dehydrogenase subunit gamma [Parapusillimonas granuli]|uniref:Formate dehydrogenase subunit gamma n=1 Tax=Parapusillimonas granuli TaxID=380911 RepID=A0A853FWY5_9BURK|nr:formate dehydrogenase subunit gamma [Parapusillimonas granuli]MBB5214489.1 formate dehydrogenase subunit gamma [Parapusillimonas granuli]MEB2398267.1 formate dehydrogenase subunit gamma [Alcaligenaceae bacterium]NYT49103.1 formate dehydrogenase subunit gamma [Parapusillimonas granuli]